MTLKAFTLIEMLVVMSVIALLLTLALPHYLGSLDRSKDIALQHNLRVLRQSIDRFHADKGRYPQTLEDLVEQKYLRAVPPDPVTESARSWVLIPARGQDADGIEDVKSAAPGASKDGIAYGAM